MTFVSFRLSRYLPIFAAASLSLLSACTGATAGHQSAAPSIAADGEEPIAYIGHGGFFDRRGRQIVPTAEWVATTQAWYRQRLIAGLSGDRRAEFAAFEGRLTEGLRAEGQGRLLVQQRSLEWLAANSPRVRANRRILGKLGALGYELNWVLPTRADTDVRRAVERFRPAPELESRLRLPDLQIAPALFFSATTNSGQDYIDECARADNSVPIPPPIGVLDPTGTAGWRSLGFIRTADQFITQTPAELRVFQNGAGMCMALPRYTDAGLGTVKLDGVICLSRTTSRVCFWDNQMMDSQLGKSVGFSFPAGTQIPIGVPDTVGGLYQAGGAEIEFGTGGACTDCHAGENPFIIHPDAELEDPLVGSSTTFTPNGIFMGLLDDAPLNLPTFGPDRYVPLVGASWPQNELSQTPSYVPAACNDCHVKGDAGRFPHLSSELNGTPADPVTGAPADPSGYCNTILAQAIDRTMPRSAPGTLSGTQPITDFQAWCGIPATSGPSDRGDPHLTTTNGINYDFQAAGEFTSLRNSDTGFELQTRQSPILTTFTPGANGYTGLASCVSLNTAAAVRVGSHRISYQPMPGEPGSTERMQLRIDGLPVALPANGVDLGGRNRIARAASGDGLDIRLADGTRLAITPNYWASEGYWYLNVEVLGTPAREGTMGHIMAPDWLPVRPNGTSFGQAPGTVPDRHALLNGAFADAWRVTDATSLFDYAPGTSTATFTNRNWPPPPGSTCTVLPGNPLPGGQPRPPVRPMNPQVAQRLCRPIRDRAAYRNCVFDLTVTGEAGMARAYLRTLQLRGAAPIDPVRSYR